MKATVANMRKLEARGEDAVAYSPETRESSSARAGDYWFLGDGCLKDSQGIDMVLARRSVLGATSQKPGRHG
jgi:hypothetical protein